MISKLAAVAYDALRGGGPAGGPERLELLHDVHALDHSPEHHVLAVKPARNNGANEELGPIRVRAGVCHREVPRGGVLQGKVLISELLAVDGLSARAVPTREITSLNHELGDDPVEAA